MSRFRITAAMLAAALLVSPVLSAATWHRTIAPAKAEAAKKNRIIFVDLFAEWCGWCHRMEREVFPTEAFQNATKGMVLLRVDTEDRGEGTKLARDYEVTKLPTFLMIDRDGLLVGIIFGFAPANEFVKRIADVETNYNAFRKEVAAEPGFRADHKRRLQLSIDYLSRRGYKQSEPRFRALATEKGVPADVSAKASYYLALNLYAQRRLADSVVVLNGLFAQQSKGESIERGRLLLGQIYYDQGNYKAALAELRNFKKSFPSSSLNASVDSLIPMVENAVRR
jgi:thioredoxin-related protein